MKPRKNDENKDDRLILNALLAGFAIVLTTQKKYFVYYKTKAVIFLIGGTSLTIFFIIEHTIYLIVLLLFLCAFLVITDNQLWKYFPFSWMYDVKDFSGTYEGIQENLYFGEFQKDSSGEKVFKEYKEHLQLTLIIYQTGSKINVNFFSLNTQNQKSSKIESSNVVLSKTEDNQHYILTCYHGDIGVPEKGGHHETVVLKFIKKDNNYCIEGGSYDNRKLQARGKFIDLKRVHQKTLHPF